MQQVKGIAPGLAAVVALSTLAGCSPPISPGVDQASPAPAPRLPVPSAAESALALGLTRTPTANQVRQSFPIGRNDPFAPANDGSLLPGGQGPANLSPADLGSSFRDLQVQGLVEAAGRQAVFISYQGQSGEVFPGQEGGKSTPFLPPGWRLVAIHARSGQIELANQAGRVIIEL